MATAKYETYGVPAAPQDPDQEFMTVQETAYVMKCSVSWLRRFLAKRPDLCGRNGKSKKIITNRDQRAAIHEARSGGDPRTGRTIPRQRRRPTVKPARAAARPTKAGPPRMRVRMRPLAIHQIPTKEWITLRDIIPLASPSASVVHGDSRLPERFWSKTQLNVTGCWEWTAQISDKGYARYSNDSRTRRAHRIAYEALVGPIPKGLVLDHVCRLRHCVNPAHLEPVTNRENLLRGERPNNAPLRKSHCPKGHSYSGVADGRGQQRCRECQRTWARESKARRQAAARARQSIQVLPLNESPQAFVDRDGDTWVPSGHTPDGEPLLSCPQPLNPEDAGEGESFAWTLRLVEVGFGPLRAVAL